MHVAVQRALCLCMHRQKMWDTCMQQGALQIDIINGRDFGLGLVSKSFRRMFRTMSEEIFGY
jgi:hypothetical protein